MQWVGSIFQNMLGNPTPNELRARNPPPPPPQSSRSFVNEEYTGRRHRQPSPSPVGLVTRLRAAGIDSPYREDYEIPRDARIVMEDMLFHIQQKSAEVSHLQRKVDNLRDESRVRKRTESESSDSRPPKRREHSALSNEPPRDSYNRPQHQQYRPRVEQRGRPRADEAQRSALTP